MMKSQDAKRFETIVIGGGQAGLAVGYHLAKRGMPFMILDAHARVGDAWRKRWDSLKLFSPARYSALPGLPFPGRGDSFPTKEQMASYLQVYAERFKLPVKTGVRVEKLSKDGDEFVLQTKDGEFRADNVVVAMGNYQEAKWPEFARELNFGIVQVHSLDYRNPLQLQDGGVLIVGVGNSGADIAMEVARTHRTWLAGKENGYIPWRIETFMGRNVMSRVIKFVGHTALTVKTPIGRKLRPKLLTKPAPLIRVKPADLVKVGIERVEKVVGARDGKPLLADDRTLEVRNVIWCTGFTPGFSWIDLPIFGEDGAPMHESGIVDRAPGLYLVGLHFLFSMTSDTIGGVGRDAERVVKAIEGRTRRSRAA
ncbi:MAG TPA: NAD(P)-binding domain-containing protein [Candidatus Acidoferrum sp.]|jgi:putative flavoprotein involved in K+ transport